MDIYQNKSRSYAQKLYIFAMEIILLWISWNILLGNWGTMIMSWFGFDFFKGDATRALVLFILMCVVFIRLKITMLVFLNRAIPWEEAIEIPFAFGLYYFGFALLGFHKEMEFGSVDIVGILIFVLGSYLNTASEYSRDRWKKKPENTGKLYTSGLFSYSMHINYFGDILWVSGLALVSRNYYAGIIPLLLLCFFIFWNIPVLDKYLSSKYRESFHEYSLKTKKLIPYIY